MSESAASGDAATQGSDSGDGGASSGGGIPDGFVRREELDAVEGRRRSLQGDRDRLAARLAEIEASAQNGGGNGNGDGGGGSAAPAAQGLSADEFIRLMDSRLAARDAMADARARVSQDFPLAHPSVLSGSYRTPEEFLVAASRSHDEAKAFQDKAAEEARQAVLADLEKAHPGITKSLVSSAPTAPPASGEGGPTPLTPERYRAMSFSERMALDPKEVQALALTHGG